MRPAFFIAVLLECKPDLSLGKNELSEFCDRQTVVILTMGDRDLSLISKQCLAIYSAPIWLTS